ncbi:hypothetical protein ACIQOU_19350 [Streptomyces sp. NPDC091279]|uniref:hypothetical protein n=1 Tax=unclassified Streptomyces TaxID=2593676 RepID=UPI003817C7F8
MSLQDDLTSVRRSVEDLLTSVGRLEKHLGPHGMDMRRVRNDANHLHESLALLQAATKPPATPSASDLVPVPDTPYDTTLWTDSDDEGVGARHHAP